MFTGPMKLPIDLDEMAVAGGLAGAPIRIANASRIDLDVPADAELVIEGLIDPELLEPEGPFGESHGHIALEDFNMSMQVTAITHKKKPVFVSIISEVTPSESSVVKRVAYEPMFLAHLRDRLSIKGVRRVVMHEPLSNLRKIIFVQCAHGMPRSEVWRALYGRVDAACRLRQDLRRGERGHRSDQCRRGVLVDGLSHEPDRRPARAAVPSARARAEDRAAQRRLDAADRRDAQSNRAAARAADARVHGERARRSGTS